MENEIHAPVRPIRTLAGYVGGKRALAGTLCERIAAIPHGVYAEPFLGMGGVFFRRARRPRVEAVNDVSRDVITLFRVLQRHHRAFMDMLDWQIASRAEFERLASVDPQTLTDLERAARFLYLQRLTFGGKVTARSFGIAANQPARFDMGRLTPLLEAAHERLAGVYVECLPWRDFIARWDRPQTLFYCDPPYWGVERYYGSGFFPREDFEALAQTLRGLKGRFVLTINDVPEVRRLFDFARMEEAALNYWVGGGEPKKARELILMGGGADAGA